MSGTNPLFLFNRERDVFSERLELNFKHYLDELYASNVSRDNVAVQTGSWVHPTSYPIGTEGSFPRSKAAEA
jgi:hypothetical protein